MKVVLVDKTFGSLSFNRRLTLTNLRLEDSVQHDTPSIGELLGDNVGDLAIALDLSVRDDYTTRVELQGFSVNNRENVLEKLWNRFHEHVKLSIIIGCKTGLPYPYSLNSFSNLVELEGMTIDPHEIADSNAAVSNPAKDSNRPPFGRKILEEGLCSDVTIVAKNGAEIKSHFNFLSACSPVLTAMFNNWTKESQSGQVDMTDVSEQAVRAFLHFIYIGDLEETEVGVAFEVFQMAEKYDVPSLKEEMITNLMGRRNESIKVELAFQMYMFTRNIESALELRNKARGILKANFKEVEALPDYEDLFIKSPKVAMEIFGDFMNSP